MNVNFYKNTSDDRRVNKEIGTAILELTGVIFKEDSSIVRPVLYCHYDNKIMTSNYLEIPTFSRYYYIDDITVASGQKLIIQCREDVLMTNKTQIYKSTAFVQRSEKQHANMYINDQLFIAQNKPIVDYVLFDPNKKFNTESGDFSLAIAGGI